MSVEGTWTPCVFTPIGTVKPVVEPRQQAGIPTRVAHGAGEEVPLGDIALDGDRLTWKQAGTEPMRLNGAFDVTVDGDTHRGAATAGRLPAPQVTGERRTAPEHQA